MPRTTKTKKQTRKAAPPSFSQLAVKDQQRIRALISSNLRRFGAFARGRYNVVRGPDVRLREQFFPESGGEEDALSVNERNRLIAFARHLARNSETMSGLCKQFEVNVVGTVGGKASFPFSGGEELREKFAEWAASCDFFDGEDFQTVLRKALRSKFLTGRTVLLFDDGLVRDSGKLIAFEGDSIANIPNADFAAKFPLGWTQHQGIIKDECGVTRGAICSMSQRGCDEFELYDSTGRLACWPLMRAEGQEWKDSPITIYQHTWRVNQIAATPAVAPALGAMMDLEDLTKYELQTAKKNSQTLATITGPAPATPPAGLDNTPIYNGTESDDAIAAAVEAAVSDASGDLELDHLDGAGVLYDILPPDAKMELLGTNHPNATMPEFVRWVQGRTAWAAGVGSVYATGKADQSYSAFRGEQMISWPAFEDEQHALETNVCDWVLRRWVPWAARKGIITSANIPFRSVSWSWPKMREVNQVDEQTAAEKRLKNCTGSLREHYGPDWKEKLLELKEELDFCRANGIPHPALITVSGQPIENTITEK